MTTQDMTARAWVIQQQTFSLLLVSAEYVTAGVDQTLSDACPLGPDLGAL